MSDEKAINLIREYAKENWMMCTDSIFQDPLLRGEAWTAGNVHTSNQEALNSLIHSCKYHAAKDILTLLGADVSDI